MYDRSRWKPRAYCYSTKKIKSASSSKWERQIPKEEDYWQQYFQKEEQNLIVRHSYPNLTSYPSIQQYPQTLNNRIRNNGDANTSNNLISSENKSFLRSASNVTSFRVNSFTKDNNFVNITEPSFTVFPSASDKFFNKLNTSKKIFKMAGIKNSSSLFPVNYNEKQKVDEIYLNRNHRLYKSDEPLRINQNGGESSENQINETHQDIINKNNLKSIKNLKNAIELSDNDNNKTNLIVNRIEDHFNLQIHKKTNRIKRKYNLRKKSEYTKSTLTKDITKINKSFTDNDFLKYSTRYAHEALKRLTKKMHFDIRKIYEKTNKISSLETMEDSKETGQKFVNVTPTSLQPLSSYDLDEKIEHYYPRTSSSKNCLNQLPKMSYFPRRKNQDRCLPCLYKSLEEICASLRKTEDENRRKKRIHEGKISIDYESNDDVSFTEINDQENQNECRVYEKEVKFDITQEKNIVEEVKLSLQEIQETMNEVKETEGFLQVQELQSTNSDDTKIEFPKSVTTSLDKSKDASNSEEDESSITYIENSSTKLKYKAACHAPTILCHSLEPLRALKLRKSMSMQARMAINESTESEIVQLDDENPKIVTEKIEQEEISKDSKNNVTEIDSKPVKKLTKIKSVSENLISDDTVNETKNKNLFRRSSSCTNFEEILKDFTKFVSHVSHSLNEDEENEQQQQQQQQQRCSLLSQNDIEENLKDLEKRNVSPTLALSTMCDMFLNRILELDDKRDKNRDKIAKRLVKLLIESKRYTNPDKFPSDLIFSLKQRPLLNGQRLRRILPIDSYNLIAPLLGIPEHYPRLPFALPKLLKSRLTKQRSDQSDSSEDIPEDLIVHPPSLKDSIIFDDDETKRTGLNPYGLFIKKERRKAIVWRPLTESDLKGYDPEATLRMRADKITTDICKEFCEWLRSLGGLEKEGLNETILKDIFEISFSADVCKSTQINVKELVTVPTDVALARLCQEACVLATTNRKLKRDAKAESKPKRTLAFGTSMPTDLLFIPPQNQVREKWLKCKRVPRELETMDVVWDGIIHLESVQAFIKWLHLHPEVSPPEIFKRLKIPKRNQKLINKNHMNGKNQSTIID